MHTSPSAGSGRGGPEDNGNIPMIVAGGPGSAAGSITERAARAKAAYLRYRDARSVNDWAGAARAKHELLRLGYRSTNRGLVGYEPISRDPTLPADPEEVPG